MSYDAAYGTERITVYLFLPLRAHPRYQAVVFFPGSAALRMCSSDSLLNLGLFDYLVEGGREIIYPVYKGTYERDDEAAASRLSPADIS